MKGPDDTVLAPPRTLTGLVTELERTMRVCADARVAGEIRGVSKELRRLTVRVGKLLGGGSAADELRVAADRLEALLEKDAE